MNNFVRRLITFSSTLLIITLCWNFFIHDKYSVKHAPYIVVYFFLLTFTLHHFLIKANRKSSQHFVKSYMGFTALKLMLNLIVVVLYIFIDRNNALNFTLFFLVIYFTFLIFEIITLQKELKK